MNTIHKHGKAFVLPSPEHAMYYSYDQHAVKTLDSNGNLNKQDEYYQDTPERAADWAVDQGYETYLLHEHVIIPDAKDPTQWQRYLKPIQKKKMMA